MIFGFSHYPISPRAPAKRATDDHAKESTLASQTPAQVYDLAHQRRLRALQSYIEQGYSLNEAARLLGVSNLTVLRWDDHGRR
jgi:transposase-like protein